MINGVFAVLRDRRPAACDAFYNLSQAALKHSLARNLDKLYPAQFEALADYWTESLCLEFAALHAIQPDLQQVWNMMEEKVHVAVDVELGRKLLKMKDFSNDCREVRSGVVVICGCSSPMRRTIFNHLKFGNF